MNKNQKNLWLSLLDEYEKQNVATTIEKAKKYIELYPKDGAAWIIIGDLYTDIARYDDALVALRKAKRFVPKERLDLVFSHIGQLYREKGSYKVAEKWFHKAVEHNPKNTRNYIFLGGLLAQMGRFDEAKLFHNKAANLKNDTWDEAHFNLGLIYRSEGNYEAALKHFDKAIEIDPDYVDAIEERNDVLNAIRTINNR